MTVSNDNAEGTATPSSANWVVDTFLDQAAWLGPHLPDPTRRGVLEWLARQFRDSTIAVLKDQLPLASPIQWEAEEAVMGLLRNADAPTVRRRAYRSSKQVTRHTDWARSYAKSQSGGFPTSFVEHRPQEVPDTQVMRGLANLCRSWAYFRQRFGYQQRSEELRETHQRLRRSWRQHGRLGPREMERLRTFDPDVFGAVMAAQTFWDRAIGDDEEMLRELLLDLVDSERALGTDRREKDDLMEPVVIAAIARAATEGTGGTGWRIQGVEYGEGVKPVILLEKGKLCCEISKNKPGAQSYELEHSVDRAKSDLAKMGIRAHGYEPDVVLRFWDLDHPGQRVFAFGDAKRNYAKDGAGYLRSNVKDTATAYLYAFAPLMGRPHGPVDPHDIGTAINPAITIFAYQGVSQIAGIGLRSEKGCAEVVKRLGREDFQFPNIVAFDRHHFESSADLDTPIDLLGAWFRRIAGQAVRALAEDRGYEFGT